MKNQPENTWPFSTTILLRAAEVLSVRTRLEDADLSERTLARIAANDRVSAKTEARFANRFVREVWTEYAPLEAAPLSDGGAERAQQFLQRWMTTWDSRVAAVLGAADGPRADRIYRRAFLRLCVVDLAARCGAAVSIGLLRADLVDNVLIAVHDNCFAQKLENFWKAHAPRKTIEELCADGGFSDEALRSWTTGMKVPEYDSVIKLAEAVAGRGKKFEGTRSALTLDLLVTAALRRVVLGLRAILDESQVRDLASAFIATAQHTCNALTVVARADLAVEVALGLARSIDVDSFLDEVATALPALPWADDYRAIRGDWSLRLRSWAHLLTGEHLESRGISADMLLAFWLDEPALRTKLNFRLPLNPQAALRAEGHRLMSIGAFREASCVLRVLCGLHGHEAQDLYNLGLCIARDELANKANYEEALYYCREAARLAPGNASFVEQQGVYLIDLGRYDEAVTTLRTERGSGSQSARAAYHLALALERLGERDAAIAEYLRARQLDPHFLDAAVNTALLLKDLGRLKEARVHAKAAHALGEPRVLLELG